MTESRPGSPSQFRLEGSSRYSQDTDDDRKDNDGSSTLTAISSGNDRDEARQKAKKAGPHSDPITPAKGLSSGRLDYEKPAQDTGVSLSAVVMPSVETASASISLPTNSESSLVDWANDRDLESPKNFKSWVKFSISLTIGLMNFIVSFAISVFSEVAPQVSLELGFDNDILQLGVSFFILGLALGPVFFGPASEYYGRKRPLVVGMMGFIGFTTLTPMLQHLGAIVICRLLAGFCGSAAYVIPPGVFVDMYGPVGRAVGYSIFASGAFVGGSLGPGVGAVLVGKFDWQWTMWATSLFAGPLVIMMMLLPETLEGIILQRKSRCLRLQTGDWSRHCRRDEAAMELADYLVKPWRMLIQEPVLVIVTTAFTLDYGIQSLTYSAIPAAFETSHHWQAEQSAWMLSITLPGFLLGCLVVVADTKLRFQKKLMAGGRIAPEQRLPPIIAGMSILALGLLFFAWKSSPFASLKEQALAEILIGQGMYMVWVTATVYVQDLYVGHANSALAACAFVRYAVGAAFPMFAAPLYDKLGVPWAAAMLGILCAVLVPFHVLFYFMGQTIRQRSKFAIHGGVSPVMDDAQDRSSSVLRETR